MESREQFQDRVRSFYLGMEQELLGIEGPANRARAYRGALMQAGLAGLSYPRSVGGQGLDPDFELAFRQASLDLLPPEDAMLTIGIDMALSTIGEYGSEELQQRFIPTGLAGEEIWCQLYSEPGAGSDLAGLTTSAVRDGDEWIVTGQKVWTSVAEHADLAILLARTDPELPKHRGITMLVLNMHQPGVNVRPLRQMTGAAEFNEVFLDEARIPVDWILGEVNGGWPLAVALLAHERTSLGQGVRTSNEAKAKTGRAPLPFDGLVQRARDQARLADPEIRQELARVYCGEQLIAWGAARDLHPSVGKLWRTIQGWRAAQLAHLIGGTSAMAWTDDDDEADYWAYHVLNCRGMSLGGGTDEIQKNTLGERVLGLPREPGAHRDTPFRDLLRN